MNQSSYPQKNRILITGDSGFIGKILVEKIVKLEIPWVGFDITRGENLLNYYELERISDIHSIDTIIHLAGVTNIDFARNNPLETYNINVLGTLNVLEFSRKINAKVIFASSSLVYGDSFSQPISEKFEREPIESYGFSKKLAEEACEFYMSNYDIKVIILRFFNIYGDYLKPDTLFSDLIKQILNPDIATIRLKNNSSSRDFIHVKDVINCIIKCLGADISGFFNVGYGQSFMPLEIAEILLKLTNIRKNISFLNPDFKKSEICANTNKMNNILKFQPKIHIEEGLSRLLRKLNFSKSNLK